eukprot:254305-Chlamydomonas_euryale.AAC.1
MGRGLPTDEMLPPTLPFMPPALPASLPSSTLSSLASALPPFPTLTNNVLQTVAPRPLPLFSHPPEVVVCPDKRKPSDNKELVHLHYTHVVDAWAVGVLAFELLAGRAPFDRGNKKATSQGKDEGVYVAGSKVKRFVAAEWGEEGRTGFWGRFSQRCVQHKRACTDSNAPLCTTAFVLHTHPSADSPQLACPLASMTHAVLCGTLRACLSPASPPSPG